MASKSGMPQEYSTSIRNNVNPKYILHNAEDVSLILGLKPSVIGPGTSDLKRCFAPTPSCGKNGNK